MTELTHLGKQSPIETDPDKVILDKIPNPMSGFACCRFTIPEMTSLCPQTGQPDFATLIIDYIPNRFLLESKALKLFIFAFRNKGSYHEKCTHDIGVRIFNEIQPIWLRIAGFWNGRGGVSIDIVREFGILPNDVRPLSIDNVKLYNNGHG